MNKQKNNKSEEVKKLFKKEAINILSFIKNKKNDSLVGIKKICKKIIFATRESGNFFCVGMTCKTNIRRDVIIIGFTIVFAIIFLLTGQYIKDMNLKLELKKEEVVAQEIAEQNLEIENINEIKSIQEQISSDNWSEYKSSWYGFKIKYPENWAAPKVEPVERDSQSVYRASFLSNKQDNNFIGFNVSVYDINKTKELAATDEFPKIKESVVLQSESCPLADSYVIETGEYPAEEIYVPASNCYDSALFFSLTDGQYIYNIAPISSKAIKPGVDLIVELSDKLPEFFVAVSSFENIDIVRPKLVDRSAPKPKITAPKPASYKVDQFGRLVCEKKNDKPSKSKKAKKKHLDMECCLDPDEYPNPHCYYDPAKYGKYLK